MRYLFTILSVILLTSCGSYRIQVREPQISNVLAITTEGDTIQVPIQALQRNLTPDYYSGYRFYWNNSWWMYNDWYWNYYYQNPRWFYPRYQIRVPNYRPKVSTPRYTPQRQPRRVEVPRQSQRRTPQVQPNRGRSNQTPRQPQYVRPSNTRTTPARSNSNSRTTSGGRVIKQ